MEILLDASDVPVNYVAMLTATVISVVLALLLTRITRPLWVKGGLEMPTTARSIATIPLLLGGYAAIMYGVLTPAGEIHNAYVEKLSTATEEQHHLTDLTPVTRNLPACVTGDRGAQAVYTWKSAGGEKTEGTIMKSAEADGACKYSLTK